MKRFSIRIDERLLAQIDEIAAKEGVTRSAFTRTLIKAELRRVEIAKLRRVEIAELERRDREGYLKEPITAAEFEWEKPFGAE